MKECVDDFAQVYQRAHNREPIDVEIMTHMEYWGRSGVVSWVKPEEHFKVDELFRRGMTFGGSSQFKQVQLGGYKSGGPIHYEY